MNFDGAVQNLFSLSVFCFQQKLRKGFEWAFRAIILLFCCHSQFWCHSVAIILPFFCHSAAILLPFCVLCVAFLSWLDSIVNFYRLAIGIL